MTIPATDRRSGPYTTNGATVNFPYDFHITADAELEVIKLDTAANTEEVLVLTTNYTVTDAGEAAGGNVVISPALAAGFEITVRGTSPLSQLTAYPTQGTYHADVLENSLDLLTKVVVEQQAQLDRCLQIAVSDNVSTVVTFAPEDGALKLLERQADGTFALVDKYAPVWDGFTTAEPPGGWATSFDPNTATMEDTMDMLASVINALKGP